MNRALFLLASVRVERPASRSPHRHACPSPARRMAPRGLGQALIFVSGSS